MGDWYKGSADEVLRHLETDRSGGLSGAEARARLIRLGPNELVEKRSRGPWLILLSQFSSTVVLVLLASAVISGLLGDLKNVVSIGAIVILNAALGFIQEHRAERALAALRRLSVPSVRVRRDGRVQSLSARELVPGDIVLLEPGNVLAADGRIIEGFALRTQEAALTGESAAVEKTPGALGSADLPLAERRNMAYAGTVVTYGRGTMVVTETGMATELGRVAAMIQSVADEATPLQKRLDKVGRRLAMAALGIVAVIFMLGMARGEDLRLMLMTAVSIAVAAVPEGLPAIVTINLAFGAQRMLRRNALIRRLPAVETLGSVTVICTDKTGTLTENKMAVVLLDVAEHRVDLRSAAIGDAGLGPTETLERRPELTMLLIGAALCNDAIVEADPKDPSKLQASGDPTETALALAAARFGLHKAELEESLPREHEFAFDSVRKRMTTVHRVLTASAALLGAGGAPVEAGRRIAFVKGSVDSLLPLSERISVNGASAPMTDEWRRRARDAHDALARSGTRVLGVAFRVLDPGADAAALSEASAERALTFVGMLGMMDPLRPEVREAVETCFAAGIRPIMITGDDPLTAQAIARELGFTERDVLTGPELDRLGKDQLDKQIAEVSVYARVSPQHKLDIVEALQKRGDVVAMTGDGVNDAPALKKADIGVSMGLAGTDVAKEASDMILMDDNFATIVAAVREGRVIYDNIRRFLQYLLTGNAGEIWLMFLGPLLGMPMPLLPVQILWMNLVTDGLPALALGVEPGGRGVMRRPPVPPQENIFGRGMAKRIVWFGAAVGLVPLAVGFWYWQRNDPIWQTMIFTTLIVLHVEMAFAFRSQDDSFFSLPLFSNKPLLAAVGASVLLQMAIVYLPLLQPFFGTVALPAGDLVISLVLSTSVFWLVEAEKWIRLYRGRKRPAETR